MLVCSDFTKDPVCHIQHQRLITDLNPRQSRQAAVAIGPAVILIHIVFGGLYVNVSQRQGVVGRRRWLNAARPRPGAGLCVALAARLRDGPRITPSASSPLPIPQPPTPPNPPTPNPPTPPKASTVPAALRWLPKVSLIKSAFQALVINEMEGMEFDADDKVGGGRGWGWRGDPYSMTVLCFVHLCYRSSQLLLTHPTTNPTDRPTQTTNPTDSNQPGQGHADRRRRAALDRV